MESAFADDAYLHTYITHMRSKEKQQLDQLNKELNLIDEDLGKVEFFCVSIKFLLNGQVDISTPSDFCENIIIHMDKLHCMFHFEKAKELLIRLSTQESTSPGHRYTNTTQKKSTSP